MKKIVLAILLAGSLGIVSCKSNKGNDTENVDSTATTTDTAAAVVDTVATTTDTVPTVTDTIPK